MKNNGLGSKQLAKLIKTLLSQVQQAIPEVLPDSIINQQKLMPRAQAFQQIHLPSNAPSLEAATKRLKFEEYFFFQLNLLLRKKSRQRPENGYVFSKVGKLFHQFYAEHLPFELTGAQKSHS